jgi:hypothetical protein
MVGLVVPDALRDRLSVRVAELDDTRLQILTYVSIRCHLEIALKLAPHGKDAFDGSIHMVTGLVTVARAGICDRPRAASVLRTGDDSEYLTR